MCNIENVKYSIELMRNAINLNMKHWQSLYSHGDTIHQAIEEMHACGTSACFAGYVAASEKFQLDGGVVGFDGEPLIDRESGSSAIAKWLNINNVIAENICGLGGKAESGEDIFYKKQIEDITPQDVIEKLEELLAGCE